MLDNLELILLTIDEAVGMTENFLHLALFTYIFLPSWITVT